MSSAARVYQSVVLEPPFDERRRQPNDDYFRRRSSLDSESTVKEDLPVIEGLDVREVYGKVMFFDTDFGASHRGILKVIQITVCFVAAVLVGSCRAVALERGFALFVCFCGIVATFAVLVAYFLTLNRLVSASVWFLFEVALGLSLVAGTLFAAIGMCAFSAVHWADLNPDWALLPGLATGALFICSLAFLVELILLIADWRHFTWRPDNGRGRNTRPSGVLPQ